MIPANGAPHDLEARDVHRSLPFAQRRVRDNTSALNSSLRCRRRRRQVEIFPNCV